ncbi:hypothetical protein ACGFZP_27005 [Kitasatospora sp. NPDC048239]|uniref:hypothetical protein n=1 Tax=Kitasatospora sp. NPDC048239 TaxID=3364046 RepID=UPI00371940CD
MPEVNATDRAFLVAVQEVSPMPGRSTAVSGAVEHRRAVGRGAVLEVRSNGGS